MLSVVFTVIYNQRGCWKEKEKTVLPTEAARGITGNRTDVKLDLCLSFVEDESSICPSLTCFGRASDFLTSVATRPQLMLWRLDGWPRLRNIPLSVRLARVLLLRRVLLQVWGKTQLPYLESER